MVLIVFLVITGRLLNRQAERTTGLCFRNQLIIAAVSFVGILVVIIVLPVDPGLRGQLLTLVGIIISVTLSLSSSTLVGNAMAGVMLKTVRNFRSGDFVKVGEHLGRVTERGLFHTEIQTPSRDLMTLPNLYLATTPITVVRSSGTIVDAARLTELQDPFVQVLDLGDYSVTYRVAMLDCLHRDGVEIVSPHFMSMRQYDARHDFVPSATANTATVAADAAVEVVFDKAEEAEVLSGLRKELGVLTERSEDLADQIKSASGDDVKKRLQRERDRTQRQVRKHQAEIDAAEQRKKTKRAKLHARPVS